MFVSPWDRKKVVVNVLLSNKKIDFQNDTRSPGQNKNTDYPLAVFNAKSWPVL
jgi:hypothetical protein